MNEMLQGAISADDAALIHEDVKNFTMVSIRVFSGADLSSQEIMGVMFPKHSVTRRVLAEVGSSTTALTSGFQMEPLLNQDACQRIATFLLHQGHTEVAEHIVRLMGLYQLAADITVEVREKFEGEAA